MKKRIAWQAVTEQDVVELGELLRAKLRVRARLNESARLSGRGGTTSTKGEVK